jgi:adenylosuccinate synthase
MLGWLLISVGLINQKCLAFIGSGVVVNVPALFNELDTLESKGECFLARQLQRTRLHRIVSSYTKLAADIARPQMRRQTLCL